jgi:hypothetical protein
LQKQLKRKNKAVERMKLELKSDELQDAAIVLFQQIRSLGVETRSCGFNIVNKEKKIATVWMSSAEGGFLAPFEMPLTKSPIYKRVYTAMKKGEDFLVKEAGGKALHGLRAKDKSFNATLHTDFDETIAKINIIPQDIGRGLLTLFNNVFML